jgi:8-oxo-dGTP pyrophosphatase MutT (NUDIX family)
MIRVPAGDRRFTLRVGAIIIHDGRVLCERGRSGATPFWFLPGGRTELGEAAAESLAREVGEELGLHATIGRLVYVVEYFFGYDGRRYHEVGLYFAVDLPAGSYPPTGTGPFARMDGDVELVFEWLPLVDLPATALYPSFFTTAPQSLPAETTHVVVKDAWAPP